MKLTKSRLKQLINEAINEEVIVPDNIDLKGSKGKDGYWVYTAEKSGFSGTGRHPIESTAKEMAMKNLKKAMRAAIEKLKKGKKKQKLNEDMSLKIIRNGKDVTALRNFQQGDEIIATFTLTGYKPTSGSQKVGKLGIGFAASRAKEQAINKMDAQVKARPPKNPADKNKVQTIIQRAKVADVGPARAKQQADQAAAKKAKVADTTADNPTRFEISPRAKEVNKIVKMMNAGEKINMSQATKYLDSGMRTLDKLKNIPEEQKDNILKGIFELILKSNYVAPSVATTAFKSLERRLQKRNYSLEKIAAMTNSAKKEINKGKKPAAKPQARDISRTIAQLAAPGPANFKVGLLKQLFTNAKKDGTVEKLRAALESSDIPKDELRKLIGLAAKAIGAEQKPDTGDTTAKGTDRRAAKGGRVNVSAADLKGLGTRSILRKVFPGMGIRAAFKKLLTLPYRHPARAAYRDAFRDGNRR